MTMQLKDDIRGFVIENFLFGEGSEKLSDADSLVEAGLIDSMGVAELVAFIETQYGITVGDEELVPDNLDSIDRVVAFVARKARPVLAAE